MISNFQNVTAPDPELMRLLETSRNRPVTEDELQKQRISFAFRQCFRFGFIAQCRKLPEREKDCGIVDAVGTNAIQREQRPIRRADHAWA